VRFPCLVCFNRRKTTEARWWRRDADNVSADLKDGVLELKLPKKEAPAARKIAVKEAK